MMLRKRKNKPEATIEVPSSRTRSLQCRDLNSLGNGQLSVKEVKSANKRQKTKEPDKDSSLLHWLKTAKPSSKKVTPVVPKTVDPYDIDKEYGAEIRNAKRIRRHKGQLMRKLKKVKKRQTRTNVEKNQPKTSSTMTKTSVLGPIPIVSTNVVFVPGSPPNEATSSGPHSITLHESDDVVSAETPTQVPSQGIMTINKSSDITEKTGNVTKRSWSKENLPNTSTATTNISVPDAVPIRSPTNVVFVPGSPPNEATSSEPHSITLHESDVVVSTSGTPTQAPSQGNMTINKSSDITEETGNVVKRSWNKENLPNTSTATTNILVSNAVPIRSPTNVVFVTNTLPNEATLSEHQFNLTLHESDIDNIPTVESSKRTLSQKNMIDSSTSRGRLEASRSVLSDLNLSNQSHSECFFLSPVRPVKKAHTNLQQSILTPIISCSRISNSNTILTSTPIVCRKNTTEKLVIQPTHPIMIYESTNEEIVRFQRVNQKTYTGRVCVINKTTRRKRNKKVYREYSSDDEIIDSSPKKSEHKKVKCCKESKEFEEWALKMNHELNMADSFELPVEKL